MPNKRIEQLAAAGAVSLSDIIPVKQATADAVQTTLSAYNSLWRGLLSSSATGLTYTAATGVFSLTSGYTIPTTASLSNYFAQGGNSFGQDQLIGTIDNYEFVIQTNSTSVAGFSTAGIFRLILPPYSGGGTQMLVVNNTGDVGVQAIPSVSAITSINGTTNAAQTIVAASTGTDFTITTVAGVTTVAIPDAAGGQRGLVTTGTQTFAGTKVFSNGITSKNVELTGTGGQGYMTLVAQSSTPANPSSGVNIFGINNQFCIENLTGFTGNFDVSGNTGNRVYTMPNATGTVALGTGQAVNRIGYWNGSTTIAGVAGFTYDGTATARIAGGASLTSWRISRDAGQSAGIGFETTGASLRWALYVDGTAEAGVNAGSNFLVRAYDDAGTYINDYITIARSTGNTGIGTSTVTNKLNIGGGHISLNTIGKTIKFTSGANGVVGSTTLAGGTKTVSTTAVTATSHIFVTVRTLGTVAAPKAMLVNTIVAGTSFVITSADATDTSTVDWIIFDEV